MHEIFIEVSEEDACRGSGKMQLLSKVYSSSERLSFVKHVLVFIYKGT